MPIEQYRAFRSAMDWSALAGAYPEFDIAQELDALAASSDDEAEPHASRILGYACHQDVLEPSAPAVVQALLLLVDEASGSAAMRLLLDFAYAAWTVPQPVGFHPLRFAFAGKRPATTPERIDRAIEYDRLCRAVQETFAAGAPLLAYVVQHNPHRAPQALAIRLLALTQQATAAVDALQNLAVSAASACIRAHARLALQASGESPDDAGTTGLLKHPDPVVRAAAASALLLQAEPANELNEDLLAPLLQLPTLDNADDFPWCGGSPGGLLADALVRSSLSMDFKIDVLVNAVAGWSSHMEDIFDFPEIRTADQIGERLFLLTFGGRLGRRDYLARDELSPEQVRVIQGVDSSLIMASPGACGIRDLEADRKRLLFEETGALDIVMTGRFASRIVAWPLWKWWYEAENYAKYAYPGNSAAAGMRMRVHEHVREQLSLAQRSAAVADARSGAYSIPPKDLAVALGVLEND